MTTPKTETMARAARAAETSALAESIAVLLGDGEVSWGVFCCGWWVGLTCLEGEWGLRAVAWCDDVELLVNVLF